MVVRVYVLCLGDMPASDDTGQERVGMRGTSFSTKEAILISSLFYVEESHLSF